MDIHASLSLAVCQTTDRPDRPVNALIVFCYAPRLLSPLRVVCLPPKMKLFNAEQPPLVQTSNKIETDEAHTKKQTKQKNRRNKDISHRFPVQAVIYLKVN